MNLLEDIGLKLNEKMMFLLFFECWWRVAIFSKKVETSVLSSKDEVKWEIKISDEISFVLSKILPAWSKLIFLSIEGRRILKLALGIVSSLKLQWTKEDALGDRWERTDLWVEVENFFLSD